MTMEIWNGSLGLERFAAIDFETANGHRGSVCSVGVVIVEEGVVKDKFYSLIRPRPNFYTRQTIRVHGLTSKDTNGAPEFPEVWDGIRDRLADMPLVAHNSMFDEGCLKAVFDAYGMLYPGYKFYCTYRLSRKKFRGLENYQLHTVAAYCGYDLTNHHHALADAEAAAVIMQSILQRSPDL